MVGYWVSPDHLDVILECKKLESVSIDRYGRIPHEWILSLASLPMMRDIGFTGSEVHPVSARKAGEINPDITFHEILDMLPELD